MIIKISAKSKQSGAHKLLRIDRMKMYIVKFLDFALIL